MCPQLGLFQWKSYPGFGKKYDRTPPCLKGINIVFPCTTRRFTVKQPIDLLISVDHNMCDKIPQVEWSHQHFRQYIHEVSIFLLKSPYFCEEKCQETPRSVACHQASPPKWCNFSAQIWYVEHTYKNRRKQDLYMDMCCICVCVRRPV